MSDDSKFWYFVGLVVSSPANVLGLILLLITGSILLYAQFRPKNKVDLTYLLVDSGIGNVTLAKFTGLGAFMTSTWVMVQLAVTNKFDATFAAAYMAVWGAVKVAADVTNAKKDG